MASLSFIIGILGNIISILVFTSPIGTFKRVVKKRSTENFKGLPYVCTLLSTSLWSFYGILKPDGLLILTVNAVGAALQATYVTLFIIFAPKETKIKTIKLVIILDVIFLGAVIAITLFAIPSNLRLTVAGFLGAALTLGMYAAPMAAMRTVIITKSVEFMPFSLSFFLFLNGGVWTIYAVLVKDYYVGVPNSIGFVLGTAQLVLYAIYKRRRPTTKGAQEEKEEAEGSAHLVKGVEMLAREDDEEDNHGEGERKNRNLEKGRSLPLSVARQLSIPRIVQTLSFSPYELNSSWAHLDDVESGDAKSSRP